MQAAGATGAVTAGGQLPKADAPKTEPAFSAAARQQRVKRVQSESARPAGLQPQTKTYRLAAAAGGVMVSEPMPEAAPVGGIAVLDEPEPVPEPLPEGVVEPDGEVDGEFIGADLVVSSIFLPQAPSANSAESATTVIAGLKETEFMGVSFKRRDRKNFIDASIY